MFFYLFIFINFFVLGKPYHLFLLQLKTVLFHSNHQGLVDGLEPADQTRFFLTGACPGCAGRSSGTTGHASVPLYFLFLMPGTGYHSRIKFTHPPRVTPGNVHGDC